MTVPNGMSDLPKGTPFRHVRNRAALLLSGATEQQMRDALYVLLVRDPAKTLDALCVAIGDE